MDSAKLRPRDWAVMVAASGGRIGLGMLFAPFVLVSLPSEQAARMFQLLFLQGGLIALLSASAYARGAQLVESGRPIWPSMRKFLGFLALASPAALSLGMPLLSVPGQTQLVEFGTLSVLTAGAAGAALNGFLQGVTVVRRGGVAAFLPSLIVTMTACVLVITLWQPQGALTVALLWGVPQVLCPTALLLAVPEARGYARRGHVGRVPESSHFALTGLVNAGNIGIAYAFRERWAAAQLATHAAAGFLVVRVSELLYQAIYMGVASLPGSLNRLFGSRLRSARAQLALLLTGVVLVPAGFVPATIWNEWTLARFVAAEVLIAPARVLTILCLLTLLARVTTRAYQVAIALGIVGSAVLMVTPRMQSSAYGLQAFQAANAAAAVLVTTVANWLDVARGQQQAVPRQHAARSGAGDAL